MKKLNWAVYMLGAGMLAAMVGLWFLAKPSTEDNRGADHMEKMRLAKAAKKKAEDDAQTALELGNVEPEKENQNEEVEKA